MLNPGDEDTSDPIHHATAGALTGLIEFSVMYPFDLIKTRMQVLKPHPNATYKSTTSAIISVIKDEGFLKFFRGMPAPLLSSVPAHALYYVTYEKMKRVLSGTKGGYKNPVAQGVAGAMAVMTHNIIMNPAEVVKQRMQVYDSAYRHSWHCFNHVLRREGWKAMYRSLPTQIIIDAPYGAIHFITYEFFQNVTNRSRIFDAKSHLISGALAGGLAAAATTPLDVCRTLLNTQEYAIVQESGDKAIKGLSDAAAVIYKTHGVRGFCQGLSPRVIFHVPSVAACWIVYEYFKRSFLNLEKTSTD